MGIVLVLIAVVVGTILLRLIFNPFSTLLGMLQIAVFLAAAGSVVIYFYGGPAAGSLEYLGWTILFTIVWLLLVLARTRATQ